MNRSLRVFCVCVLSPALIPVVAAAQDAAPGVRITRPIDASQLTALKNTVHPLANARNDRGAAPDDMRLNRIQLVLQRSASQESDLRQLIQQMHAPGSGSYHKWLTPTQFGARFGPSDQDIATVENWLTGQGFSVSGVSPSKLTIEFSGDVAHFRSAFHTQIRRYMVNGQMHTANATNPEIPTALTPVVAGFASLNNFPAKSEATVRGKVAYDPKTDHATPEWTTGNPTIGLSLLLSPQDFAVQYDLNPLYAAGTNGSGQTIAIVNDSNINVGLVNAYRKLYGLPANPVRVIVDGNDPGVNGINNPDGQNGAAIEAYLDVELAGAVAPKATIDLVIAGDTEVQTGLFLAAQRAVYSDVAPVVSISFGGCEASYSAYLPFIGELWEEAAAQGQTVMVSAGDAGSAGCDNFDTETFASYGLAVSDGASTPWNVAVGGTDFYYSQYNGTSAVLNTQLGTYWNLTPSNTTPAVSLKSVIPEQPWNNSQYGMDIDSWYGINGYTTIQAGGGGASAYWPKPAWQSGAGVPNDGARDLPDVSLFAATGANLSYYPICAADGDCQPVSDGNTVQVTVGDGTSAATPSFAGMMALVDQLYGPQGQADYVLYPLAAQYPQAFHDVTVGTNTVPCDFTDATPDCIAVSNPITDPNTGVTEGEIGTGTTADYNAGPGYDLASGLGSVDAYQMVSNWNKVKFAGTTTTLAASQTTFAHGTPITLSGTVTAASGTPTGAVAIESDNTEANKQGVGVFSLSGGAYSGTNAALPGGSYNLWAAYTGDTVNGSSSSAKVPITVTPEASTTRVRVVDMQGLTLNPGASEPYGTQLIADTQSVPTTYYNQCIVSSSPPASCSNGYAYPTGSVTFTDNGTAINTAVIDVQGDAEYNGAFGVGNHSLAAKYAGDSSYDASNSSTETFKVVRNVPTVFGFSTALNFFLQAAAGEPIPLQMQVTNSANYGVYTAYGLPPVTQAAAPTGTITITGLPNGIPNTATLSPETETWSGSPAAEGTATLTLPPSLPAGNYNLNFKYSGDANYKAASSTLPITVLATGRLTSTTTASISGGVSPTSSGVTISGTVTGQTGQPSPTGEVDIYANGNLVGGSNLSSSSGDVATYSAVIPGGNFGPGTNQLVVEYFGDSVYDRSSTTLGSIQGEGSDFSVQTTAATVPVAAGSSGTAQIELGSIQGFSGTVKLSCGAAVGVTCSIPATATLTSGGSSTVALTISAGADTANLTYSVPITATDSSGAFVHTLYVQAVVTGSPAGTKSFFLNPSLSGLSLASGVGPGAGTTISVWPLGGYTGTVSLKCTVSATGKAVAPACSLTNTSLSLSGTTPQMTFLNVSSNGTTARNGPGPLGWPAAGGSALAVLLCFAVPRRRRCWLALVALLAVVIGVGGLGCGDNGPTVQAASVGTYTVTVTGTSGSLTQSASVTVNVGPN